MDIDVIVDHEVENLKSQDKDNENDNDDDDGCLLRISDVDQASGVSLSHTRSTRSTLMIQTREELFTSLNRILVCWCLRSSL